MTEKELNQAKELAKEVFKTTMIKGGVIEVLSHKFDEETLKFFIKAIIGAFETGFDCCTQYVIGKED